MQYVDCKVIGPTEFEISWGWPMSNVVELSAPGQDGASARPIDKTVTHAVIEYTDGDEVKQVTVKTSPHTFKGWPNSNIFSCD